MVLAIRLPDQITHTGRAHAGNPGLGPDFTKVTPNKNNELPASAHIQSQIEFLAEHGCVTTSVTLTLTLTLTLTMP